jgi:hypothetical protein
MAGRTGLEPATSGVTGRRSNRLNYHPLLMGLQPLEAALSGQLLVNFSTFPMSRDVLTD